MSILDLFSLHGKVAVVTGASSGLGVAFAVALAEAGADVALGARRVEKLEATQLQIEKLGRRSIAVKTDVTVPESCQNFASEVIGSFGQIDVLINCAGLGSAVPASRELPDDFRRVIETNLMGTYWMSQACAKFMQTGASIINIGSILGFTSTGLPQAAYASSKTAIVGLTRDLAQQWSGRKGIRVNALAPGFFLTEMTDELDEQYLKTVIRNRVPMGRTGALEECAAAVIFLASDASSYVTGITIPVDGGLLTS